MIIFSFSFIYLYECIIGSSSEPVRYVRPARSLSAWRDLHQYGHGTRLWVPQCRLRWTLLWERYNNYTYKREKSRKRPIGSQYSVNMLWYDRSSYVMTRYSSRIIDPCIRNAAITDRFSDDRERIPIIPLAIIQDSESFPKMSGGKRPRPIVIRSSILPFCCCKVFFKRFSSAASQARLFRAGSRRRWRKLIADGSSTAAMGSGRLTEEERSLILWSCAALHWDWIPWRRHQKRRNNFFFFFLFHRIKDRKDRYYIQQRLGFYIV